MEDATGARRLPAGADVQAIAETADGVDIGSARTRFDPAARGALVRLPLQSRQRAASAIVRVRGDGMLFTDRVIVPHATVLAGDAVAYRNGAPAAVLTCARSDRLRFECPSWRRSRRSTHGSSTAGDNRLRSGCRSCKVDRTTNGSRRSSWPWRHSAVAITWSSSLSAPMA
jgi:hypothetical protein